MSDAPPTFGLQPGFSMDNVAGLQEARDALEHFSLLRGLTSGGEDDFFFRFGAVADLVHADQTLWTLDALERRFGWMEADRIVSVVRALRRSGWLETVGQAYRLSSDGLAVYATISRLGSLRTGRHDDLAMGVFDLEASTRLGEDTGPALRHLQHHLRRQIEDVEAAIASQSELKVMEVREKLDLNLDWSRRARMLIDSLDIERDDGYRASQRLGRDLSELHKWHSVMQRTLDEIGRQRLPVGALGVRPADLDRFLCQLEIDEILELAGDTLHESVWPLVGILDNLVSVAEWELLYGEDRDQRQVGWREGAGEVAEIGEPAPSEGEVAYEAFGRRMRDIVLEAKPVALERLMLAGSFPKSCYRMTLMALEDELDAGRATVRIDPGSVRLYSDFASEISKGRVIPRVKEGPADGLDGGAAADGDEGAET